MAYAIDPNQEQNQQAAQTGQPIPTGAPVASSASAGKSPNQPTSAAPPAPFTNLQSYLSVNAPQIQGMAGKVADQLGNTYNTAKGTIDTAGQNFSNAVKGGYAAPDQSLVDQAAANPTEFVKNADNVTNFQKQFSNKYAGPENFNTQPDYQTAQGAAQNALDQSTALNSYYGLQSYLSKNLENNPTQAIGAIDTAILNQSPEAIKTVNTAAQPLKTLGDYLTSISTAKNAEVSDAQKAADQAAQYARGKFTGAGGLNETFTKGLIDTVAKDQAEAQARQDAAKAALSVSPQDAQNPAIVSDQTLADLGITRDQLTTMISQNLILSGKIGMPGGGSLLEPIGKDLNNYLTFRSPAAELNFANVATPEDYARAQALAQLTGEDFSQYIDPANVEKAGTANLDLSDFDTKAIDEIANLYNENIIWPVPGEKTPPPMIEKPILPGTDPNDIPDEPVYVPGPASGLIGIPAHGYIDPVTGEKKIAW